MLLAAIDIGGTSIKYAVVNDVGEFLYHHSTPTEAMHGGKEVVRKVTDISNHLKKDWDIEGIAISSAGQINSHLGTVVYATDNIPEYTGIALAKEVSNGTGLPVTAENDVNCTALGEYWKGAAAGKNSFLCVSIGTGIGGAIFLNGHLYRGETYAAGEFGHMSLYPRGRSCTCGNHGCWEQYGSSAALSALVEETIGFKQDLEEFFETVKEGNSLSLDTFDRWTDDLTTGLQSLVHTFNVDLVVIGGGISAQGQWLENAIQKALDNKLMQNHRKSLEIKLASTYNKANLLGAVRHYLTSQQ